MKKRVCVIGAGVSGLAALRHLSTVTDQFDVVSYERSSEIGGIWVYTPDNSGPRPNPMYRDMKTNLQKEVMCYPDFPYSRATGDDSFLSHLAVLQYLREYAVHFGLEKFIQFRKGVELVHPIFTSPQNEQVLKWEVTVKDLDNPQTPVQIHRFDFVMVCNGHFWKPFVPTVPSMSSYRGQVLHSQTYRACDEYAGKSVMIVGSKFSAIDIALEIAQVAKEVVLSVRRTEPLTFELPGNVRQVGHIEGAVETGFVCRRLKGDGDKREEPTKVVEVDAIIFCTGYEYDFPFLSPACGLKIIADGQYVTPLYKDLVHALYPSLCIIALQQRIIPFVMADIEVRYYLAFMEGKFQIPNAPKGKDRAIAGDGRRSHIIADLQWQYYEDLVTEAGLDPVGTLYPCVIGSFVDPERRLSVRGRNAFVRSMHDAGRTRRETVPGLFKNDRVQIRASAQNHGLDFEYIKMNHVCHGLNKLTHD